MISTVYVYYILSLRVLLQINQHVAGELILDLSRMPRGSSNSKNCTLKLLEPQLPTINLFKVTRIRAWWPFARSIAAGKYIQAVKYQKGGNLVKLS